MRIFGWMVMAVLAAGCGSDDDDDQGTAQSGLGGSCTNPMRCFEVSNPPDYDVKFECDLVSETWSSAACDQTLYATKCTSDTAVSRNGGPSQIVTYVYYFVAGFDAGCGGTIEDL